MMNDSFGVGRVTAIAASSAVTSEPDQEWWGSNFMLPPPVAYQHQEGSSTLGAYFIDINNAKSNDLIMIIVSTIVAIKPCWYPASNTSNNHQW